MRLMTKSTTVFDRSITFLAILAGILIIFIVLIVIAEVVTRTFLGYSLRGALQVAEICLLYITFLGAAWVLKRDGHVKMDLVLNLFKPKTQFLVNFITSFLGVLIWLTFTWYSAQTTWQHFQSGYFVSAVVEIPTAPILIVIAVGSFLLSIQSARRGYGYLNSFRALRN